MNVECSCHFPFFHTEICTALLFNIFLFLSGYSETTFLATITLGTTPANPLVFDVAVINTGGFYNTATGIYTVPVDGVYEFTVHLFTTAESDDAGAAFLVVDNTRVSHSQIHRELLCWRS